MLRATFSSLTARKLRLVALVARRSSSASRSSPATFVLTDSLGKVFDDLFSTVARTSPSTSAATKVTSDDQGGDVGRLLPQASPTTVDSVDGVARGPGPGPGPARSWSTRTARPSAPAARRPSASTGTTPTCCRAGPSSRAGRRPGRTRSPSTRAAPTAPTTRSATRRRPHRSPLKTYTIVGIVEFDGKGSYAGETTSSSTRRPPSRCSTCPDSSTRSPSPRTAASARPSCATAIAEVLPPRPRRSPAKAVAEEQADQVKQGLGFFNTFLLTFALIALFVGAFIIFNTFSMLVAQRTRELALMRALGASRGQVRRAVLLEAVGRRPAQLGDRPDRRDRRRASASRRCSACSARSCPTGRRSSRPARSSCRSWSARWSRRPRPSCRPAAPAGSPRSPPCAMLPPPRPLAASGRPSSAPSCCSSARSLMAKALARRRPPAARASARCSRSSASRCSRRWSAGRSHRSSDGCSPGGCPAGSAGRTPSATRAAPRPPRPR